LIFPSYRLAVFVHGCFWHGHDCARGSRQPKSNQQYWTKKIARNVERDKKVLAQLKRMGWKSRIIWGCAVEEGAQSLLKELNKLRAKQAGNSGITSKFVGKENLFNAKGQRDKGSKV
jgi:DNA mismatch endonuclease (patch repair protein)